MAELRAGPASLAGLEWLVRVGVAPMEAWACAMGWGDRVARSHASRLERAGWLERHRMIRGQGSLLAATRRGVRMSGLPVSAPAAPDPASWAHDSGCLDGRMAGHAWRERVARPARGAHRPRPEP